jgi:hypothetical protein
MKTLEETLRDLMELRDRYRDKYTEQLNQMDETMEHLGAIIEMVQKDMLAQPVSAPRPMVPGPAVAEFPIGKLRNLTQLQAVVAIATHNRGTVKAQDAKRLMIQAKVMKETKNSTNITHNVIIRSKKFDRVGPGEYRLKVIAADPMSEDVESAARHSLFGSKPVQ